MEVKILVFNEEFVATRFSRMANATADAAPALEEIADYLMQRADAKFSSEGRAGGGSWKKLTPKWLTFKEKHGFSSRILVKKGVLRQAMTKRDAPGQVLEIGPHRLKFGTNIPYAATQQFGRPGKGIPARPFLGANNTDKQAIRNIVREYILKA